MKNVNQKITRILNLISPNRIYIKNREKQEVY